MSTTVAVHVPAWKRVGLKLKSVEAVAGVGEAPPPLPTPEVEDPGVAAAGEEEGRGKKKKKKKKKEKKGGKAPEDESEEARKERKKKKKERKEAEKEKEKEKETKAEPDKDKDKPTTPKNPPATTKSLLRTTASTSTLRKSVTFTSDTKATDGDSIKTLYQNHDPFAHYDSYQQHLANYPVNELPAGFDDPPAPAERAKKEKDTGEQQQGQAQVKYKFESTGKRKKFSDNDDDDAAAAAAASGKDTTAAGATTTTTTTTPPAPASKKRKTAPTTTSNTLSHLTYLRTHHDQRASWRFEKAKQNWILRHALDPALIPATHGDALAGYVAGLQGAGARDRLLAAANDVVKRGADTVGRDGERVDVLLQRAGVERARLVLAALGHAEDDEDDDDEGSGSEDGSE